MTALSKVSISAQRRPAKRSSSPTPAQRRKQVQRLSPARVGLVSQRAVEVYENVETGEVQELEVRFERRLDHLEKEHAHGRISDAAYLVGRQLQQVLEAAQRSLSPSAIGDGIGGDPVASRARRMAAMKVGAEMRVAEMKLVQEVVGSYGAQILRRFLEGASFRDLAGGDNAGLVAVRDVRIAYMADKVRSFLEAIAKAKCARGPSRSRGVVGDRADGWFAEGVNGPDDLPANDAA